MTLQKGANLMHHYVEKQVFSWRAKISFLMTLIFFALLRGKAGFLMTRQKGANLLHFYVSKHDFSWSTKNSYIWCIITWKSRFSHDTPKMYKFVALLRGKPGFLITCQKLLYLMFYYMEKQVFSWHAKKVQICCINTWKSRFSHDTPKRSKCVALLRFEAGFLMKHQEFLYLMHYYVENQVFS